MTTCNYDYNVIDKCSAGTYTLHTMVACVCPRILHIDPSMHAGISSSAPNGKTILLDMALWDIWKDYSGKLEGYIYTGKNHHKGICIRKMGEMNNENILNFDLSVNNKAKWEVKVTSRSSDLWNPTDDHTFKTTNTWALTLLVLALIKFGNSFGGWHLCCNNCRKWSSGFVEFIQDPKEYKHLNLENPPTGNMIEFKEYYKEKHNCSILFS